MKKKHLQLVKPAEIDPEELRTVKLHGFAQGILNAYEQLKKGATLTSQGIQAAALESAIKYQNAHLCVNVVNVSSSIGCCSCCPGAQ